MSAKLQEIRHFAGRKNHLVHTRSVGKHSNNSPEQTYFRKMAARNQRREQFASDPEIDAYITWIFDIQKRLQLSIESFARRLGVSAQTVKLWKNKSGVLPSKKVYQKLLILERESLIPVTDLKIRYGVRFS